MTAAERASLRCSMQARAGEIRPVVTAVAVARADRGEARRPLEDDA